jgi:hypothetical protein
MQALRVEAQHSRLGVADWGKTIGVRSTLILTIKGGKAKGGFLILEYQKSFSPP